jgi:polysaccharide biosynthesis transport protein
VSEPLDIGASLTRRAAEPATADADAGEAAWDLPNQAEPAAEPPPARPSPPRRLDPPEDDPDEDAAAPPLPAFAPLPGFGDEPEPAPAGPKLDIMRFVRGVWQRKWIVVAIAIIMTLLFLLLALSLPHTWRASVTLISETHQDPFQISDVPPFRQQDYELQTFIDTIKLPSSLDATMQRAGISVLRMTMAAAIGVGVGRDSKLFSISVTWDDPQSAARIANIVADLFIENAAALRRQNTEQTFNDYSTQLREARVALEQINTEVLAYEEAHQIASLDNQLMVLVGQVSTLDADYRTTIAEAGALRAALTGIEAQMAAEPEMVVAISRYYSPFKQRLSEYQWELREARTRYTEENPKIQRIQKRIETLEQLINESGDEVAPENEYRLNPKRGELSLRATELQDEIKVVEARAGAVKETLEDARAGLAALTVARTGYQDLTARLAEAEKLVDKLAARVAEVRVTLLRNDPGFSILERAAPPILPEPSMRKLVAIAGVILGGGLGLFVALALELLDPLVRTARDAEGSVGCGLAFEFQDAPHPDDAIIDHVVPTAPVSVLFRTIINDIATALEPQEWRSLAITSAEPASGRSLIAVNLASALALKDELTLLVDADLRADAGPRPEHLLGVEALHAAADITDVLNGTAATEDAFAPTTNPFVQLLSAGDYEDDRALLLLGNRSFRDLVRRLKRERTHVLYDLPPVNAMESVIEAAAAVGNVLLVARSGHTRRADLKAAAAALTARDIAIRAVIVTGVPQRLLAGKPTYRDEPPPKPGRKDKHKKEPLVVEDDLLAI